MSEGLNYYRVATLEKLAPSRLPGYLDHIREVGIPVLSAGAIIGYTLTKEQTLDIKIRFNPDDAAGIEAQRQRVEVYQRLKESERLRKVEIDAWITQVTDPLTPCNFGGCAELKRALDADLISLGEDCTSCQTSQVTNRYKNIIRKLWTEHDKYESAPSAAAVLAALTAMRNDLHHVVVHNRPAGASDEDATPAWIPEEVRRLLA